MWERSYKWATKVSIELPLVFVMFDRSSISGGGLFRAKRVEWKERDFPWFFLTITNNHQQQQKFVSRVVGSFGHRDQREMVEAVGKEIMREKAKRGKIEEAKEKKNESKMRWLVERSLSQEREGKSEPKQTRWDSVRALSWMWMCEWESGDTDRRIVGWMRNTLTRQWTRMHLRRAREWWRWGNKGRWSRKVERQESEKVGETERVRVVFSISSNR